tara:strand:- start:207 stop:431 length:225 start_codon:yes stop_codon:yes gene_type:complete
MRNHKPYPNSWERSSQGLQRSKRFIRRLPLPPIQNKGDNMTENKIPNITLALYELDRLMAQVNANREAGDEIVK